MRRRDDVSSVDVRVRTVSFVAARTAHLVSQELMDANQVKYLHGVGLVIRRCGSACPHSAE